MLTRMDVASSFLFLSLSLSLSFFVHPLFFSFRPITTGARETPRDDVHLNGGFKNFKRISVGKLGTRWKRRYDTLLTHACRRDARGRFEKICTTNTPPLWPSSVVLLFQSHVDPRVPVRNATLRKRNYSTHIFAFVTRETIRERRSFYTYHTITPIEITRFSSSSLVWTWEFRDSSNFSVDRLRHDQKRVYATCVTNETRNLHESIISINLKPNCSANSFKQLLRYFWNFTRGVLTTRRIMYVEAMKVYIFIKMIFKFIILYTIVCTIIRYCGKIINYKEFYILYFFLLYLYLYFIIFIYLYYIFFLYLYFSAYDVRVKETNRFFARVKNLFHCLLWHTFVLF